MYHNVYLASFVRKFLTDLIQLIGSTCHSCRISLLEFFVFKRKKNKKIAVLVFSLLSRWSLLEIPIVVIQKFCYHGNVTTHFSSLFRLRSNGIGRIFEWDRSNTVEPLLTATSPQRPFFLTCSSYLSAIFNVTDQP